MKELFKLDWLSRGIYITWMVSTIIIAFISYMTLIGFMMWWVDTGRLIIAISASCVLIMIYIITRRLINIYKYLGVLGLFYFFILYSMFSYDSMLHDWVANVNWFVYYMIWIALAFLLAFVPKLWNIENNPTEGQETVKYKTAVQIIFLVIVASIISNLLIPTESSIYRPPNTTQERVTDNTINAKLPTQNYWSYLDNNNFKHIK